MTQRLRNITVVWVGSEQGGGSLLEACRREGARVERQPLIVFGPPQDPAKLALVCETLDNFSWIVFTSSQAVRALWGREPPRAKIAAVGPSTRDSLISMGWTVDLVPDRNDSSGLVMEFEQIPRSPKPVLFVRGDRAKRTLPDGLATLGFAVAEVEAYATLEVDHGRAKEIAQRLGEVANVVLAGSPSGVQTLERVLGPGKLGELGRDLHWVCLGEATFAALRRAGVAEPVFPEAVTPQAVVDGITRTLGGEK